MAPGQYASRMHAAGSPYAPVQPGLGAVGPNRLSYRELSPPPALAADVVTLWEIAAPAPLPERFVYRVAPDGCVDLVFDLRAGDAWLFGTRIASFAVELTGDVALFAIRVRPGRLGRLVQHPAGAFAGSSFALEEVLGNAARRLATRLAEQPSSSARGAVVADELHTTTVRTADDTAGRAVADAIVAGGGTTRVAAVARALGMSPRHLQRVCRAATGLGPKQLGRVVRFQRALGCLTSGRPLSLATLAADLGYADQAHLTGDLQELLGTTPGVLVRAAARSDFSKQRPSTRR